MRARVTGESPSDSPVFACIGLGKVKSTFNKERTRKAREKGDGGFLGCAR